MCSFVKPQKARNENYKWEKNNAMKITTLLFDLDGTLLPMDQDTFAKAYVTGLSKTAGNLEYEPMSFAAAE